MEMTYNGNAQHFVIGVVNDDSGRAQHMVVLDRGNGVLYALQYSGTTMRLPEVPAKGTQGWQNVPIVGYWEFMEDRKSLKSLPPRIQQLFISMFGYVMSDAAAYKQEYTRMAEQRAQMSRQLEELKYELREARSALARAQSAAAAAAPKAPTVEKSAKKPAPKPKTTMERYYGLQATTTTNIFDEPTFNWLNPTEENF